MPWRRIDDMLDVHPKIEKLRKLGRRRFSAAMAVWLLAGCHASRAQGTFPVEIVPKLGCDSGWRSVRDLVSVGLLIDLGGGTFRFHNWYVYNETEEQKDRKKQAGRDRSKRYRERESAKRNASRVTGRHALVTVPRPDPTRPVLINTPPTPVTEDTRPGEIRELEGRYPPSVVTEARVACALTRDKRKMGDGPWLKTLRKLAEYPREASLNAMEVFVDRYADGEHDEKYMIGIARNYRPQDREEREPMIKPEPSYSEAVAAARADAAAHNEKLDEKRGTG